MKVTLLGTGTSQGIPVIACKCGACTSSDPRDRRLRTAAFVEVDGVSICIDVGPDFRQQMLSNKIDKLDAVLLTHEHNDHMIGADDVRPFNFRQQRDMQVYGEERVLEEIKARFKYAFEPHPYPGIPRFILTPVEEGRVFYVNGLVVEPIRVEHGSLPILGFRIKDFCYLTDVKSIPEREFSKLEGIKVLVLSALRKRAHHSHMTLDEAIEMARRIDAEKTYFTHFSHDMGPLAEWEGELPENVEAGYDGQVIFL